MGRPSQVALLQNAESYSRIDFEALGEETAPRKKCQEYMASAWRVLSFFTVVFVLPTILISLPLYARYHLYHTRHLPLTETDSMALHDTVSSFWCQGQRVSGNATFDAWLVSGSPKRQRRRKDVLISKDTTLVGDDIEYWGLYLIKGSTFTISSAARWPGGVLLVVQGEENLNKCMYREERLQEELEADDKLRNHYKNLRATQTTPTESEKSKTRVKEQKAHSESVPDKHQLEDPELNEEGGEVFDNEKDENVDADLIKLLEEKKKHESSLRQLKQRVRQLKEKSKQERKNGKERKRKIRKEEIQEISNNRNIPKDNAHNAPIEGVLSRSKRSIPFYNRTLEPEDLSRDEILERVKILRMLNDTIEVFAGNSSYSSSEEFLENCRDTMLSQDLTPFLNLEEHLSLDLDNPNTFQLFVNESSYVYFIYTSDNSEEVNDIGFRLKVRRSQYDVSSPISSCRNETECIFPLDFMHSEGVIVEVSAGPNATREGDAISLRALHNYELTTTCQPRVAVYMVFILLVPFIILSFAFQ